MAPRMPSTLSSSTKSSKYLLSSPLGLKTLCTIVPRSISIVFSSSPSTSSIARMSRLKSLCPQSYVVCRVRRTLTRMPAWSSVEFRRKAVWAANMDASSCADRAAVAISLARRTSVMEESDRLATRRWVTSVSTGISGGEDRCDSEERLSEADEEPWLRRTEAAGEAILGVCGI